MKHAWLGLAGLAIVSTAAWAADGAVAVAVGRVAVVRSNKSVATVAVGDPTIADVVAEGDNTVLVFGKKTGRTDLVLIDRQHHLVRRASVVVGPGGAGDDTIIVRRSGADGVSDDSWMCTPTCAKVSGK